MKAFFREGHVPRDPLAPAAAGSKGLCAPARLAQVMSVGQEAPRDLPHAFKLSQTTGAKSPSATSPFSLSLSSPFFVKLGLLPRQTRHRPAPNRNLSGSSHLAPDFRLRISVEESATGGLRPSGRRQKRNPRKRRDIGTCWREAEGRLL